MTLKIANAITAFNSASGGPPRTVALIARSGIGYWTSELFTTDAMGGSGDSLLTDDFPGHVTLMPASSQRALRGLLMSFGLMRAYEAQLLHGVAPDVLHIHGMWNPYLAAFARTAIKHRIPYIVAPHGMLEPWSLSAHGWRKSIALRTYQGRVLAQAAGIHATSDAEAQNLRRLSWVRAPIFVIPNAVEEPKHLRTSTMRKGARSVLLFMSRLHEKKGLDILLQAWNYVRPPNWTLLIVGRGESSYVERLKRFCISEDVPDVEFRDHADGEVREQIFADSSALILPTYSENFGNVVAEALIRGLPVLTTTGTPWSVVSEQRFGWYFTPDVNQLRRVLLELQATDTAELRAMGERGRLYAGANLSVTAVRDQLLHMYMKVAQRV
jgi:glycosyltransferase involved in cell wall biosynthesis